MGDKLKLKTDYLEKVKCIKRIEIKVLRFNRKNKKERKQKVVRGMTQLSILRNCFKIIYSMKKNVH